MAKEDVFLDYAAPALMLYRIYPPVDMPATNSHVGGLPYLPDDVEWPKAADGTVLHFIACIDCAELPSNKQLPEQGILFFFARVDEEMLWSEEGEDPQDHSRVIFRSDIGNTPRPTPKELKKIEGGWSQFEDNFQLPDEPDFVVYPKWPLMSKSFTSWPDIEALKDAPRDEYDRLEKARLQEAAQVTGLTIPRKKNAPSWEKEYGKLVFPKDTKHKFPQLWIMIDRIARYIANELSSTKITAHKPYVASARAWIERAQLSGLGNRVDRNDADAFQGFLRKLYDAGVYRTEAALRAGMQSALQFAAQTPETAARFPSKYYTEMQEEHLPIAFDLTVNEPVTQFHQMLGHPKSEQEPPPVERDYVLLAQFFSDYGVDFMFCDVGVAEFWINKEDLAAHRFDKAWATTEGG